MSKTIKTILAATALASAFAAAPAFADEAPASDVTITGNVAMTTQYRLRGISQSDNTIAVQGGLTAAHSSGAYVGTWASSLGGYGTFGGSNTELDLIAGYTKAIGAVTLDGGAVYYVYPGTSGHDYFEIYGAASGKLGPVNAKLGTYWAPKQNNIGGHNIWVYTDMGLPLAGTPVTLKAHGGYSSGNSGYTHGKDVIDYAVGADFAYKNLTLNLSYVGTDLKKTFADANFGGGAKSGHAITTGNVVATLTAAF
ncbi:MAG: reductase system porin TorF [Pseudomonadota bacterium]|jgi:uncharacterized protein (TIGR02001 family)